MKESYLVNLMGVPVPNLVAALVWQKDKRVISTKLFNGKTHIRHVNSVSSL